MGGTANTDKLGYTLERPSCLGESSSFKRLWDARPYPPSPLFPAGVWWLGGGWGVILCQSFEYHPSDTSQGSCQSLERHMTPKDTETTQSLLAASLGF